MGIKITRSLGPTLSSKDILAIETEIGLELPADYKALMLRSNGAWLEPIHAFRWLDDSVSKIQTLDKLRPKTEYGVHSSLGDLRKLNLCSMFPFTSTTNDDYLCFDTEQNNSVVLVEHTNRSIPKIYPVAASFSDFIDKLFEIPEPKCEIEELARTGTLSDFKAYLASGKLLESLGVHNQRLIERAVCHSNLEILEQCVLHDSLFYNALHLAASSNKTAIVTYLISSGADVNQEDEHGLRPINYVAGTAIPGEMGAANQSMLDLLIKLGSKPR